MFRGQRGEDSQSLRTPRYPQGAWQKDNSRKTRFNFSPTRGGPVKKGDDKADLDLDGEALEDGDPPSQFPEGRKADHGPVEKGQSRGRSRGWRGSRRFGKGKGKGKFKGKGKGKKRW